MVKGRRVQLVFLLAFTLYTLMHPEQLLGQQVECYDLDIGNKSVSLTTSNQYIARDDTFHFTRSCDKAVLTGTVIENDLISSNEVSVCYVFSPSNGILTFGTQGRFTFTPANLKSGLTSFRYRLCNSNDHQFYSEAIVHIFVEHDSDCDGIFDHFDLDNDNDGIPDSIENIDNRDTDQDGYPDYLDIDSDNDGITDFEEWQEENNILYHEEQDSNGDGLDNAFDVATGGVWYSPVDTDSDNIPDYLDTDSDNDGISDHIEAFDMNRDDDADVIPFLVDTDKDGLDDAFDTLDYTPGLCNAVGSCSPLPDWNNNGMRDWRDKYIFIEQEDKLPLTPLVSEFKIYPNPSKGNVYIEIPENNSESTSQLMIISPNGAILGSWNLHQGINHIQLGNNLSGLIILKIHTDQGQYHEKLLLYN